MRFDRRPSSIATVPSPFSLYDNRPVIHDGFNGWLLLVKLLLTTQSYRKEVATPYGLLLEMDAGNGQILRQLRIDTPLESALPGERLKPGLRGICRFRGQLYVCTWNRVYIVDPDTFQVSAELSHRWMSDLHGIHVNDDGLWLTSSLPDALLLYDFKGRPQASFWVPESSLYTSPVPVDRDMDWRLRGKGFRGFKQFHANHVTVSGETVYLTGRGQGDRSGRVVCFDRRQFIDTGTLGNGDLRVFADGLHGPHDGESAADGFWVTETRVSGICKLDTTGAVRVRRQVSSRAERTLRARARLFFGVLSRKSRKMRHGRITHWTRGLALTHTDIFIGQSTWAGDSGARARGAHGPSDPGDQRPFLYRHCGLPGNTDFPALCVTGFPHGLILRTASVDHCPASGGRLRSSRLIAQITGSQKYIQLGKGLDISR